MSGFVESASIQKPMHPRVPVKSWIEQVWLKSHAEECPMHAQSDSGPVIEQASPYELLFHAPDRR